MADLEDRLRTAVQRQVEAYSPAPDLEQRITARVRRRQRTRRVRTAVAVAAAVVAVVAGGGVLVPRTDRDVMTTEGPEPTTRPSTTERSPSTTVGTTPGTAAGDATTTPAPRESVPPRSGDGPAIEPVTRPELQALTIPFSLGIERLPAPCYEYWQVTGAGTAPPADGNAIAVDTEAMALGDVDGDGVDDGIAAYICETPGTIPPGGLLVLLADGRVVVADDGDELAGAHQQRFGDPRNRVQGPVGVVPAGQPGAGQVSARTAAYRPEDANCCPSTGAEVRFRLEAGVLRLVELIAD